MVIEGVWIMGPKLWGSLKHFGLIPTARNRILPTCEGGKQRGLGEGKFRGKLALPGSQNKRNGVS